MFSCKRRYINTEKFEISVTGYDNLIGCIVEKKGEDYFSTIDLKFLKPIDDFIKNKTLNDQKISVVYLPGISHTFLDQRRFKFDEDNCLKEAKKIIQQLNLTKLPAVGVIWFGGNQINPVVYVKDIDSLFYENSCGSGSIAYGIYHVYLKNRDGLFNFDVIQKNKEIVKVIIELRDKIITSAKLYGQTKFSL